MSIVHNTYADGKVQSLGFQDGSQRTSLGVVLPGRYDFGTIQIAERIVVTRGHLIINGMWYKVGETCRVEVGCRVVIETTQASCYICFYDQ